MDPDPELDDLIGLVREADRSTARWLIDCAFQALDCGYSGVSYSRRQAWYASANQAGLHLSHTRIIRAVTYLEERGLIINMVAPPQPDRAPWNWQSWFTLSPSLFAWLSERGGVLSDRRVICGNLVRLKHRSKRLQLPVPRTDLTRKLEREARVMNELVAEADWQPSSDHFRGRRGDVTIIDAGMAGGRRYVHRGRTGYIQLLTPDGSLHDCVGGRAYGWSLQNLPKAVRRAGLIGGERVDEVDFNALHPKLVLLQYGFPLPDGDLYVSICEVSGESRDVVKRAVNIGLNAGTEKSALGAIATEIAGLEERFRRKDDYIRARLLQAAISRCYPPLGEQIGCDAGVRLTLIESDILRRACMMLDRQGVPLVPLHDALIVSESNAGKAKEAMEEGARRVMGFALPTTRLLAA